MGKLPTYVYDVTGKMIYLGDILEDMGSLYYVCLEENHFYLTLISGLGDSCRNIPYSFNKENEYKVIYSK